MIRTIGVAGFQQGFEGLLAQHQLGHDIQALPLTLANGTQLLQQGRGFDWQRLGQGFGPLLRRQRRSLADQLQQRLSVLTHSFRVHVLDARQRYQIIRLGTGQRPQRMLAQDAIAWLVARARLALAPGTQRAKHGLLLTREFPGQLGLTPGVFRGDLAAQIGHQLGTILNNPLDLLRRQTGLQCAVHLHQMQHVFGGVAHLQFGQWPLQPVRAGFSLGQLDIEQRLHQARVAHGEAEIEITGRQLRIEQRRRQAAGQAQEDLQVFTTRMQHLDHAWRFEQRSKRSPVADTQGVDQVGAVASADLQQPGDRVEGVDAHELGVQGDEWLRLPGGAMLGQAGVVENPVNVVSHAALPSRMPRSIYAQACARGSSLPPISGTV